MNTLTRIFFLLLFIISVGNVNAQNLKFKHVSVEDGLSNSTIECIFQDHRGFIWFGTRDGLNKYDGNQITVFKHSKNENSISDNFIRCIFEDQNHTLWIGTSDGLNRFNAEKNNFATYRSKDKKNQANNIITSIKETNKGIWVGTYGGGLNLFDKTTNTFSRYVYQSDPLKTDRKDYINDLYCDATGNIWMATDAGIRVLNLKSGSATAIKTLENESFRVIKKDADGSFWFGTEENGLIHFDPKKTRLKPTSTRKKMAIALAAI
jgi:ligand-binding sensor domain-containing protein